MTSKLVVAIVGSGLSLGTVFAQPSPAEAPGQSRPTFRAAVDLVSVAAVVRDKRGQVVRNLARDDFEVFDNGVRRPILEFSQADNGPVSLAVLMDVSGSMSVASHLAAAQQALDILLQRLRPGEDEVALFSFDRGLTEHHGFTRDPSVIREEARRLLPYGITSLYDAIAETARRVESRDYKRRAILVLTDGVDNASRLTAAEVSGVASATDVPVYVLAVMSQIDHEQATHTAAPEETPTGQLTNLASWTGGSTFVVSMPAHASIATTTLLSELRHQYVFAFEAADAPGWRHLDVRTRKRDFNVRARSGYFAAQHASSLGN